VTASIYGLAKYRKTNENYGERLMGADALPVV
jgi:hypothetical protein